MPQPKRPTAVLLAALVASTLLFAACDPEPEPPVAPALATVDFVGPVASLVELTGAYVFVGPPATIEATAATPRVSGVASAQLGYNLANGPGFADVGLCWRPVVGGPLTNFNGNAFSTARFSTERDTYSAIATRVFPAGTYLVGMCVRNNSQYRINNNGLVTGWVQVTA